MPSRRRASSSAARPGRFVAFAAAGAALTLAFFVLLPTPRVHAQAGIPYWGPLLSCTGNYNQVVPVGTDPDSVKETCNSVCDLLHTTQNVTNFAITMVLFVGVPLMVAWGGIMIMVAGGSPEKRKTATTTIVSAVIGALIVLGAYVIMNTFLWLFGNGPESAIQVSWPEIKCELPPPPQSS